MIDSWSCYRLPVRRTDSSIGCKRKIFRSQTHGETVDHIFETRKEMALGGVRVRSMPSKISLAADSTNYQESNEERSIERPPQATDLQSASHPLTPRSAQPHVEPRSLLSGSLLSGHPHGHGGWEMIDEGDDTMADWEMIAATERIEPMTAEQRDQVSSCLQVVNEGSEALKTSQSNATATHREEEWLQSVGRGGEPPPDDKCDDGIRKTKSARAASGESEAEEACFSCLDVLKPRRVVENTPRIENTSHMVGIQDPPHARLEICSSKPQYEPK